MFHFQGYYQNAEGQTQCDKCAVGYYQNLEGESQCNKCSEGTIAKDEGTVDCTACDLVRIPLKRECFMTVNFTG